jgi:uncharacterized protein
LSKEQGICILFHGGEPLLQFSLIEEIVTFALNEAKEANRVSFKIQTNGSLFTDKIISFLDKHNFSVGLSLNGLTRESNMHRVTKNGSSSLEIFHKNMRDYGEFLRRRSGIVCVLSKLNIGEIPNFILWLQDVGIGGIYINTLNTSGLGQHVINDFVSPEEVIKLLCVLIDMIRNNDIKYFSIENINKFINSLVKLQAVDVCHKNPCGAGGEFLVIDAEGNYRACDCVYHDYLLLNASDPKQIIHDTTRIKIQNRITYMKDHVCTDCAIFGFCGGSCVAESVMNNGTDRMPDEMNCKIKKFMYKTLLKEYALEKRKPLFEYYSRFKY